MSDVIGEFGTLNGSNACSLPLRVRENKCKGSEILGFTKDLKLQARGFSTSLEENRI
jgi:hypothetical protein